MTSPAATRRMVASVFRARNARNAADAMKNASREKIVDWSGWKNRSSIHLKGVEDPSGMKPIPWPVHAPYTPNPPVTKSPISRTAANGQPLSRREIFLELFWTTFTTPRRSAKPARMISH